MLFFIILQPPINGEKCQALDRRLSHFPGCAEGPSRDPHYTFIETLPWSMKRNPRVFNGKYISVTRQDDGTYRLNFKPLKTGEGFNLEHYALGVYNEICIAIGGLIEK